MFSNCSLHDSWLVAMARFLLIVVETEQYVAIQFLFFKKTNINFMEPMTIFEHRYFHALVDFATAGNRTFTFTSLSPILNRCDICKCTFSH